MTSKTQRSLILGVLLSASIGKAEIIQHWTFNSLIDDGNPTTGTSWSLGKLHSPLGFGQNTTGIFVDGVGSSDPNTTDDSAFGVVGFSLSPTGPDKTEGLGFSVNVPGFRDIQLTLDVLFTETSVDRLQVQYNDSLGRWVDFSTIISSGPGWMNDISLSFSSIPVSEDRPDFAVRFVRLYASEAGFQSPGGGAYSGGMIGFDDVVISGVPVPEPNALALSGIGLAALGALQYRASRQTGRFPSNNR